MSNRKAVQEISGVKIELGSFINERFCDSEVKLYTSPAINVLKFIFPDGGTKMFLRFNQDSHAIIPSIAGVDDVSKVYLELAGFTSDSVSGGTKFSSHGKNPWRKYCREVKFYCEGEKAFISTNEASGFEFLMDVEEHMEEDLSELLLNYVKLPKNVYKFEYMSEDIDTGDVFCVAYPAYDFSYNTMEAWVVKPGGVVIPCVIDNFTRFRDGGTTEIRFKQNDKEHLFKSPTVFSGDKNNYIDERKLSRQVCETVFGYVVDQLGLSVDSEEMGESRVIERIN